jgi:cysteine desulfurase
MMKESVPAAAKAKKAVYLDYAATTPVDPRVAQKMSACLLVEGNFGNPASRSHVYGWEAEEAVEHARTQVAAVINADPREIIWTSGATESDNLALKGVAEGAGKRHIVTSAIEHKAVLDTCAYLEGKGFEVTYLVPGKDGIVRPEQVEAALREDTLIVSIMHANNEIGVINDVAAIGAVCRKAGVTMHTDAAQTFGKIPLDVQTMALDLISISGHKIYGPKGIGALYVRREPPVRLTPLIHGGGHERGLRSGTLATHQIVGFGEAAAIMAREREREHERVLALRQRLWSHLKQIPGTVINGDEDQRLPGLLNVAFEGVHVGQRGAELRAPCAGASGRSGPRLAQVHHRPLHHRRGGGFRRATGSRGSDPASFRQLMRLVRRAASARRHGISPVNAYNTRPLAGAIP